MKTGYKGRRTTIFFDYHDDGPDGRRVYAIELADVPVWVWKVFLLFARMKYRLKRFGHGRQ